jgi:protein-S-isoprenylcysteine O-methyltransferase Ste14
MTPPSGPPASRPASGTAPAPAPDPAPDRADAGATSSSPSLGARAVGFVAGLAGMVSLLIVIPALLFGGWGTAEISVALTLYLVFFGIGTGRRLIRQGDLATRKEDHQVRTGAGRVAALLAIPGFVFAHGLAVYTFARGLGEGAHDASLGMGLSGWALAGIALGVVGLGLNHVATRTLGAFFDRIAIKDNHELVTHGVYARIRHPIYTSYLCIFFGFVLMMESPQGALAMLAVCALWFGTRIPIEEAMLEERFGEAYRAYQKRTARLVPFLY